MGITLGEQLFRADDVRNHVMLPAHSSLDAAEILAVLDGLGMHSKVLFQSSGSTGNPRLIVHSKRGLLASAKAVNDHLGVGENDSWLCALPDWHVGGFAIYCRASLSGSMVYSFPEDWGAEAFVTACEQHQTSLTSLVPTQVFDLVAEQKPAVASLRAVLVGGGRLDAQIELQARELGWPIYRTYGLTELASQVATQTAEGGELQVLPHVHCRIGDDGRLQLRGESLADGYLQRETSGNWQLEPLIEDDADGWFHTDDLVELEGNNLSFLGRASNRIKVLGELVDVEALEQALLQHFPPAADIALVATADERTENAIVLAYVNSLGQNELEPIIQAFNLTVAGFERISRLVGVTAIPRGALGKISRRELQRMVEEAEK